MDRKVGNGNEKNGKRLGVLPAWDEEDPWRNRVLLSLGANLACMKIRWCQWLVLQDMEPSSSLVPPEVERGRPHYRKGASSSPTSETTH